MTEGKHKRKQPFGGLRTPRLNTEKTVNITKHDKELLGATIIHRLLFLLCVIVFVADCNCINHCCYIIP